MVTTEQQTTADPILNQDLGHGNTVAAWAMFGVMFVGVVVSCIAFIIPNWIVFWAGGVVIVIGLIVGMVLKAAGYGVGGKHTKTQH